MNHEHQRRHREQRDRREILLRVVGQLAGEQAGIDHERAVDDADGVAVRRRGRDRLRADLRSRRRRDCRPRTIARARARDAAGSAAPECRTRRPAHTARSPAPGAADSPARRRAAISAASARPSQNGSAVQHRVSHSLKFASSSSSGAGPSPGVSGICTTPFSIGTLLPYGTWPRSQKKRSSATSFSLAARMCKVAR